MMMTFMLIIADNAAADGAAGTMDTPDDDAPPGFEHVVPGTHTVGNIADRLADVQVYMICSKVSSQHCNGCLFRGFRCQSLWPLPVPLLLAFIYIVSYSWLCRPSFDI